MGWEKHRPTYNNIHLVVFHSSISCCPKTSIKKTTPNTSNSQIPAHKQTLVFVHFERTGCPKSDEGGSQFPYSLLQPSHQLLFISWTTFIFQRGNAEVSQKGFHREACLGFLRLLQSFPRWTGLYQWSAQRSSRDRPQQAVNFGPGCLACFTSQQLIIWCTSCWKRCF